MDKTVIRTNTDFRRWLNTAHYTRMAFDTETTSLDYCELDIQGFSLCDGHKACYVNLVQNKAREAILGSLSHLLTCGKMELLIMHNSSFDLAVLHKIGICSPQSHKNDPQTNLCSIYDTQIAAYLLDENRPTNSLKYLAETELGHVTISYEEAAKYGPNTTLFADYATNDAIWTWELYEKYTPELTRQNLDTLFYKVEMPFQWVLRDFAINGVLLDKEEILRQLDLAERQIMELTKKLCDLSNTPYVIQQTMVRLDEVKCHINFNSTQQRVQILQKLGYKLKDKTDSGGYSTSTDALEKISGTPFIDTLIKYLEIHSLRDKFLSKIHTYVSPDGRVRASVNGAVVVTGRLSVSKPPLQQLPDADRTDLDFDIRKCFIAPKGKKLIALDYCGQEIRILADQSKDPVLIDCIETGKDVHLTSANRIFDLNIPEEYTQETSEHYEETKTTYKNERHKAKNGVVFPLIYGKAEYGIAKDFNITEKEAKGWIDKFFQLCPNVAKSIRNCHRFLSRHKYVYTKTGRRRRFDKIDNRAKRQAYNCLIQGTAADMLKRAMIGLRQLLMLNPKWEAIMVLTVHDEIVVEVKDEFAEYAAECMKAVMINAYKLCVPLDVSYGIGQTYSDAK